ncbi:MAG: hypothetical protein VB980_06405 [Opitutales bacterium]
MLFLIERTYLITQEEKALMEQKPIPFTTTSEGSVYAANPTDWHELFLITMKWCLILAGLSLSIYFGYRILTG